MSGAGVLAALARAGRRRARVRPGRARPRRAAPRRLRALLHRAARPPRRGRHASRARSSCSAFPTPAPACMASAIAMDKVMTKRVWIAEGLPTPRFVRLAPDEQGREQLRAVPDVLGLPLIVKPPREGSSIGITKVAGYSQMQDAVAARRALRRRRAVRGVHRGRRGDLPGARRGRRRPRAAGGAHRRARGRLRLPEQVLHRRRPLRVPERPAGGRGSARSGASSWPPTAPSAAAAGAAPT